MQTLSRGLASRGHEVVVVAQTADGSATRVEADHEVKVFRLQGSTKCLRRFYRQPEMLYHLPIPDPVVARQLKRILKREAPDIVHAHSWMMYSYLPVHTRGTRVVVTAHDYGFVCAKKSYIYRDQTCSGPGPMKCLGCSSRHYGYVKGTAIASGLWASGTLHPRIDAWYAVGRTVATATHGGRKLGDVSIEVIPTFIPDEAVEVGRAAPRPTFVPNQGEYLIFVGALGTHKGLNVLLEAYRGLAPTLPLVIIGTPQHDTPDSWPAGATVHTSVEHADVMAALRHSALAVVPSTWEEPLPQVAIEAMACGRPVIASAVGGLRDLVSSGRDGVLVKPGDSVALREAIRTLLAAPGLRHRLGAAAEITARSYFASAAVAMLEERFMELCAGAPSRRDGTMSDRRPS